MSYLGRHHVGSSISLGVPSVNTSNAPTMPTSAPIAKLFTAAGAQVGSDVKLPVHDKLGHDAAGANGAFFLKRHLLNSSYSAGRHLVLYQWTISGVTYHESDSFDILAGGDADGTVIGLYALQRPEAMNVLYQTESGELKTGRNPE